MIVLLKLLFWLALLLAILILLSRRRGGGGGWRGGPRPPRPGSGDPGEARKIANDLIGRAGDGAVREAGSRECEPSGSVRDTK